MSDQDKNDTTVEDNIRQGAIDKFSGEQTERGSKVSIPEFNVQGSRSGRIPAEEKQQQPSERRTGTIFQ